MVQEAPRLRTCTVIKGRKQGTRSKTRTRLGPKDEGFGEGESERPPSRDQGVTRPSLEQEEHPPVLPLETREKGTEVDDTRCGFWRFPEPCRSVERGNRPGGDVVGRAPLDPERRNL